MNRYIGCKICEITTEAAGCIQGFLEDHFELGASRPYHLDLCSLELNSRRTRNDFWLGAWPDTIIACVCLIPRSYREVPAESVMCQMSAAEPRGALPEIHKFVAFG